MSCYSVRVVIEVEETEVWKVQSVIGLNRSTLCLDYLSLLLKHMTGPLKTLPKDEVVEKGVEFMDEYSISQEDFESLTVMAKFQKALKKRAQEMLEPIDDGVIDGDGVLENEEKNSVVVEYEGDAEEKPKPDIATCGS
ncbi:hypothetical protein L1887_23646 [Cichorium endivia]|nr:hypothetical protein L1887_23646 [Cichorium endivia]